MTPSNLKQLINVELTNCCMNMVTSERQKGPTRFLIQKTSLNPVVAQPTTTHPTSSLSYQKCKNHKMTEARQIDGDSNSDLLLRWLRLAVGQCRPSMMLGLLLSTALFPSIERANLRVNLITSVVRKWLSERKFLY